jgi:hypothetical protein
LHRGLDLGESLRSQAVLPAPFGQPQPFVGVVQIGTAAKEFVRPRDIGAQSQYSLAGNQRLADDTLDAILIAHTLNIALERMLVIENEHLARGRFIWRAGVCRPEPDPQECCASE